MKYDTLKAFDADFSRMSKREKSLFMEAVHKMIEACRREPGRVPRWPASLRVKSLQGFPGVYEMTWSYSGPDGRATFDYATEEGDLILRWRRVGGHEIFREP